MTLAATKKSTGRFALPVAALVGLSLLAGCASHNARLDSTQEAAGYAAHAQSNYVAPGPPEDPWGPYIREAAARFDVPDHWVRGVMRQESGGRLYEHGTLITSPTGAMGLMQVEPGTYDELRARYDLGSDPYDPHANILAGVAYMRELYDLYGAPAFLAAYNAGPGRLDDYLARNRPLPDETRHYVAVIGPSLYGSQPLRLADAQNVAMNQIPVNIPSGPRYPVRTRNGGGYAVASNEPRSRRGAARYELLPSPPLPTPEPPPTYAMAQLPKSGHGGFRLIGRAYADTIPVRASGPASGDWGIQVGAFATPALAHAAAEQAHGGVGGHVVVTETQGPRGKLYRARVVGLSHGSAATGCERAGHGKCILVSPSSQS